MIFLLNYLMLLEHICLVCTPTLLCTLTGLLKHFSKYKVSIMFCTKCTQGKHRVAKKLKFVYTTKDKVSKKTMKIYLRVMLYCLVVFWCYKFLLIYIQFISRSNCLKNVSSFLVLLEKNFKCIQIFQGKLILNFLWSKKIQGVLYLWEFY